MANATVIRAGHARTVDWIGLDQTQVVQAALFHDVLEDTLRTPTDLRVAGFPQSVVDTVLVLIKPQEPVSYVTHIEQIIASGNLSAILIEMSNNEDNLSPDRTLPAGDALAAR